MRGCWGIVRGSLGDGDILLGVLYGAAGGIVRDCLGYGDRLLGLL